MYSRCVSNGEIEAVQFYVLSSREIQKESSVSIETHELYKNNKSNLNGLNSKKLGVTDHMEICATCRNTINCCTGHDGHLVLNYPIINPLYFGEIKKWLRVVCFNCGQLLVSELVYSKYPIGQRLTELAKAKKSDDKPCPNCGHKHPSIKYDKSLLQPKVEPALHFLKKRIDSIGFPLQKTTIEKVPFHEEKLTFHQKGAETLPFC